MKKMTVLLLLCLLLCGCTENRVQETTLPAQTQSTQPTEPAGIYNAGSEIEELTAGAVRAYPLDVAAAYNLEMMGDALVVFSGDETTTLTCLAGENLYIRSQVELNFRLEVRASTQVTARGISYFDPVTNEMVFLDTALKEVKRFAVPEDLTGAPVMSANRQIMYYCTGDSIRALDLETGISRLLKQTASPVQTLEGLLLNESILQCAATDDGSGWNLLFLSTETGATIAQTRLALTLTSAGDTYYAMFGEGSIQSFVYGKADQAASQLLPRDINASGWYLKEQGAVVTVSGLEQPVLERYDLETGLRGACVALAEGYYPWCVTAGADTGFVWFLCDDPTNDRETVCRWDLAASAAADETVYTGPRYTEKNPASEELAQCAELARELSTRYGLEILIGSEATQVQPWDYTLETEFQAPVILGELEKLERILAYYPDGYFLSAAEGTESGKLKISIVRSLTGKPESGSLGTALGLQFWVEEEAYLAIAAGESFERTFCHEMFHIAETLVLVRSKAYDDWETLNPEGFAYDYDYIANESRTDYQYLDGENRAFIDTYSMSFPKEDRARIMEYAMMADNAHYFQSEIMQNKLRTLCLGIREAFNLKKSPETFLWEQYLEESLAYTNG